MTSDTVSPDLSLVQNPAGQQTASSGQPTTTAKHAAQAINSLKPVKVSDRISFGRLVHVEFRKFFDTRAGQWLIALALVGAVLAAAGIALLYGPWSDAVGTIWSTPANIIALPVNLLIPVVIVLLFTQEWGQRTTLTTFAIEPRRGRVLAAKGVVGLIISTLSWVFVQLLSALSSVAGGAFTGSKVDWTMQGKELLGLFAGFTLTNAMAAGFGLLLMNTAAAIVLFMALPMVIQTLTIAGEKVREVISWLDLTSASSVFYIDPTPANGWWKLLVATTIWAILPITAGVVRNLRREAK